MSADFQQIAKILKSNGTEGELVLSFPYMDPEEIERKEPVYVCFDGLPVPFFIESLTRRGNTKALVRLTDIESYADAEELVGKEVYLKSEATEDGWEDGDYSFLIGWTLKDTKGAKCGEITDFIDIPSNPCIEIGGNSLVPLHEDLLVSFDEENSVLIMDIPDGLLNR